MAARFYVCRRPIDILSVYLTQMLMDVEQENIRWRSEVSALVIFSQHIGVYANHHRLVSFHNKYFSGQQIH